MRTQTKIIDFIIKAFIWLFTLIAIAALVWIVGFVLIKGLPNISWTFLTTDYKNIYNPTIPLIITILSIIVITVFGYITIRKAINKVYKSNFDKVSSMAWLITKITVLIVICFLMIISLSNPGNAIDSTTGILPMIVTTIAVIILTLIISTPIGICSAIYLVEYARPGKMLNIIRFATESLAGIPSIIYGLFGYIFFNLALGFNYSLISGSLTLSIMVLPTIIRTTEEALKTVPMSYREGSLALGATKLTTIFKVILPSAISGILTAIILSIGRIVGETAAVIFTLGTAIDMPKDFMSSGRTLATHMYNLAREGTSENAAYATATVLIIVVAIINISARRVAGSFQKKLNLKT